MTQSFSILWKNRSAICLKNLASIGICLLALTACGDDAPAPAPEAPPQQSSAVVPTAPVSPAVIQTLKPARMVVRPSNVQMGPVLPGSSENKVVVISNEGEEALTINELRLDADPTELSASGSCLVSMPLVLARSQSCEISLLFTPLQPGGQLNGEIVISPEGDNPPAFVPITAVRAVPAPQALPPAPTVYAPSAGVENAIALYRERRQGRMVVVENELERSPGDIITKDQDYTPIGFAPTISTLPVDRSRLITADKYIPAILENTINSQLAGGRIVGIVEQHVYGGDGRYVLLPAGSRAIGVYESLARQGDTRLRASFVRVMRPDGAAIAIEGDPASDIMGRLGLVGDVDNRYFERFAGPLLISLINAVGTYATSPDTIISSESTGLTTTTQTLTPEQQAYQNFANDLSFISQRLVEENLNLAPIITIPGGTRFYIMPTRDIMLQNYSLVSAVPPVPNDNAPTQTAAAPVGTGQAAGPGTTAPGTGRPANVGSSSPNVSGSSAQPGYIP